MFTNIDTVDSVVNLYVESDSQSNHGYQDLDKWPKGLYRRFERHCNRTQLGEKKRCDLNQILYREWNQLLAASTNKTERFRISTLSAIHVFGIIKLPKVQNWKLSIAGSAIVKETAVQQS